jgi:hypothetical protein
MIRLVVSRGATMHSSQLMSPSSPSFPRRPLRAGILRCLRFFFAVFSLSQSACGTKGSRPVSNDSALSGPEQRLREVESQQPADPPKGDVDRTGPSSFAKDELDILKKCCVLLNQVGQGMGQEGTQFIGLSSVCDETAIAIEVGVPVPRLEDGDHALFQELLTHKRITPSCKKMLERLRH